MSMARRGIDPALLVILAGVSAALHVGKLPPALPVLREALGVSLLQAGFLLSLVQLAGMGLGLAVGLAADGLGLRRSMLIGLGVLCAAGLLGGWARGPADLLVLRALEGFGFLLVSLPAPSLVRQLVAPARLSAMLGLWGAYMPLGTALALLAGPWVMAVLGWQGWWWLLALLSGAMALWLAQALPSDAARQAGAPAPSVAMAGGWWPRLRQTLGAPGPWLVALCFAMYSGQWLAVIGFLPTVYAQAGLAGGAAGALTALAAAVNMSGNIASGRLLQRGVPARRLLHLGFVAMFAGAWLAFGLGEGASPALRYAGVLLFSALGGLIPGTLFSQAVHLAPNERTVSTTVGWVQQWSALGQFFGPPLVAWVAGQVGGWGWTWAVTGACSAVGMGLALRMARLRRG
ncbi:MFS transporter [Ramlibacter sp. 2FC]|uniref:MFS transporter n=1 Tax=Ramlibacter sp. 2FC TaxID=2502188 RepID=UPI0010F4542E|nr:MFS transporter [Ramlibacter sp. 2FC]